MNNVPTRPETRFLSGRRAAAAVLIALFACASSGAQSADRPEEAKIVNVSFLPIKRYVGDVCEARITFTSTNEPGEGEIVIPSEYGSVQTRSDGSGDERETVVHSARIVRTQSGWILVVSFTCFSPEKGTLPRFDLGAVMVPPVPFAMSSVLEDSKHRDTAPARPQFDLPGTAFALWAIGGALITAGIAALAIALWILPAVRAILLKKKALRAYSKFEKTAEWLASKRGDASPERTLAVLEKSFRTYLSDRIFPDWASTTASEAHNPPHALSEATRSAFDNPALPETAVEEYDELMKKIVRVLSASSKVRYARKDATRIEVDGTIETARAAAKSYEEALRAHP